METLELKKLPESVPDVQNPEQRPAALPAYLGRAARRGTSEEAYHARQGLQDSLDLREQGYAQE